MTTAIWLLSPRSFYCSIGSDWTSHERGFHISVQRHSLTLLLLLKALRYRCMSRFLWEPACCLAPPWAATLPLWGSPPKAHLFNLDFSSVFHWCPFSEPHSSVSVPLSYATAAMTYAAKAISVCACAVRFPPSESPVHVCVNSVVKASCMRVPWGALQCVSRGTTWPWCVSSA